MKSIILTIALSIFILLGFRSYAEDKPQDLLPKNLPVAPTDILVGTSNKKDVESLDLPYKPKVDDEVLSIDGNLTLEDLHPDVEKKADKKPEVDWSKIPFIPSKYPEFPPLPDPDILAKDEGGNQQDL